MHTANRATGHGYESQSNYPASRIDFYNIPNIHGVRGAYVKLAALAGAAAGDPSFGRRVEDSGWPSTVRLILKAAVETAALLGRQVPVLVHCSHGWDRTAQVCGLGTICSL